MSLRSVLKNLYLWVLTLPVILLVVLISMGIQPDDISLPGRVGVFFVLAYVAARYAGSTPKLIWTGDRSPESRNITGWALFLISQMAVQCYAILTIALSENGVRPAWLSSNYYSPAFVLLGLVGLGLVASSIPRFPRPPFFGPGSGASAMSSFIIAVLSAGSLWIIAHFPAFAKLVGGLFAALGRAV